MRCSSRKAKKPATKVYKPAIINIKKDTNNILKNNFASSKFQANKKSNNVLEYKSSSKRSRRK